MRGIEAISEVRGAEIAQDQQRKAALRALKELLIENNIISEKGDEDVDQLFKKAFSDWIEELVQESPSLLSNLGWLLSPEWINKMSSLVLLSEILKTHQHNTFLALETINEVLDKQITFNDRPTALVDRDH